MTMRADTGQNDPIPSVGSRVEPAGTDLRRKR